jgi:alcohol dehydrogenase (NADP+)
MTTTATTTTRAFGATEAGGELIPLTIERRAALRPDDVAIDIDYCGVCHSDAHQVDDDWRNTAYPCVPGHEIIGRVAAVGSAVTRFVVGDRVGVGCMVDSCQDCESCRSGEEQFCTGGMTTTYNGRDRHTQEVTYGGYSEHVVVRDRFVLQIPEGLDPRFAGPLLCAGVTVWTPLRRCRVGTGSRVAVIGLGGLGHLAVKLAKALGAEVTVVTTSPAKADDADALGADRVLLSTDREAMAGAASAFDVVVDTVPMRHDVNPYLTLLGRGGTLVLVGAIEPIEPVHGGLLMRNNRSLTGSLIGGVAATQELLDFCAEHEVVPLCELVGPESINTAFKRMRAGDVKYRFVIDLAMERD